MYDPFREREERLETTDEQLVVQAQGVITACRG
jgi:hypothetical protein